MIPFFNCGWDIRSSDNCICCGITINYYMILKVRHIDKGINPSSVNQIYFNGDFLLKGVRIGIVAGMVALTVR